MDIKLLKFRRSDNNDKKELLFKEIQSDKYIAGIDPYDDNSESKVVVFKNGEIIDLRTKEKINYENKVFMNNKNNPKELEYWRNIFPNKTDNELEEYRTKWSKENPKYLKFNKL